jgi:cell division protein FtsA
MEVSKKKRIVCGLDVGTTKICMMIARTHPNGSLEVISSGYANSKGLKKGVVVDLEEAATSIRKAAYEAELKSNISADWVIVGAAGDHFRGFNSHGAITIDGDHQEVTTEEMAQVIRAAQSSMPLSGDREIIHVLPQEFFLDDYGGIQNPVGLHGSRLDVNVHIVTCQSSLNQNMIHAVNRAQMRVKKVVLQQLASAEAVLTKDEKELGTVLIDIGGGTTDIAVFVNNAVHFTSVLPVGGSHFTRDLAVKLQTPIDDAERIKKESGTVWSERISEGETAEAPGMGVRTARSVPRSIICKTLRYRAIELLELIKDQIWSAGENEHLIAGAVVTGGGSMLNGILELAEETLAIPVRQGLPLGIQGLTDELSHPVYSTAVGLALCGAQEVRYSKPEADKASYYPWLFNRILSWAGS